MPPESKEPEILMIDSENLLCDFEDLVRLPNTIYISVDWSIEFYLAQAYQGMIATAIRDKYLLPELQSSYCTLDWLDLRVGKGFRKSLKNATSNGWKFEIKLAESLEAVLEGIKTAHGESSWLSLKYAAILKELFGRRDFKYRGAKFRLVAVELRASQSDQKPVLVAGEVGYVFGTVYTSLTGFTKRSKNSEFPKSVSLGTLQLLALSKILACSNFQFWNLGHPPRGALMRYKAELGGRVVSREEFLVRWRAGRSAIRETSLDYPWEQLLVGQGRDATLGLI